MFLISEKIMELFIDRLQKKSYYEIKALGSNAEYLPMKEFLDNQLVYTFL